MLLQCCNASLYRAYSVGCHCRPPISQKDNRRYHIFHFFNQSIPMVLINNSNREVFEMKAKGAAITCVQIKQLEHVHCRRSKR